MRRYDCDATWRNTQAFLPLSCRLTPESLPDEYYLSVDTSRIHIDHYRVIKPKATLILFHGVGGNGRLLSFIAVPLMKNGFEVICPDLPLYGLTEYTGAIAYDTWVEVGKHIVFHYQSQGADNIFLFGLSAGGMLAYQVACVSMHIKGIMATCILDQRESLVVRETATNRILGSIAKPILRFACRYFGRVRIPMKLAANMKAIANNEELAGLLMQDRKSSGAKVPLSFLSSMLNPQVAVEPENFTSCPFLLVHPEKDTWTDVRLSRIFFDRLACKKYLYMLDGAGHFPVEEKGLLQMSGHCSKFIAALVFPPDK